VRIAIVNDLPLAVEALRRTVVASGRHQVAWTAENGLIAVGKCADDTPDLILMDLMMPVMDGVEAIRRIMKESPCLILVVTASVDSHCGKVFEAMGAGALDVVRTPNLSDPEGQQRMIRKIEMLGRLGGKETNSSPGSAALSTAAVGPPPLVAIGSSAGGPAALADLLTALPADLPAGVVIIQHVDAQFAQGLVTWLNGQTRLTVRAAREGDRIEAGIVLVAVMDQHLAFTGPERLGYIEGPPGMNYRPSVDVFFASVARHWKQPVVAAVLTGMGKDGAKGLKSLRDLGHPTIAQDQASSAVYGMPKAAADLGGAAEILPLNRIAERIRQHLEQFRHRSAR
jgi:two-component system response regulator WspF